MVSFLVCGVSNALDSPQDDLISDDLPAVHVHVDGWEEETEDSENDDQDNDDQDIDNMGDSFS